jgi:hypothetical protein
MIACTLVLLPLAMPIRACCDDAWSCIAAFATGGLSCVVENLVNSIRSMIQNVDHLVRTLAQQTADIVNLARNELGGAANDLRNLASQAEGDFNGAIRLAQTIVDEESKPMTMRVAPMGLAPRGTATSVATLPPGAVAGTGTAASKSGVAGAKALPPGPGISPPAAAGATLAINLPADPKDVLDAVKRAQAALLALRPEVANPLGSVRQFANQAEQQALAAASSAGHIAESALLAPLRTLGTVLLDLVNHPERIFDPSRIVDDAMTSVTDQIINTMNQVHEAVMSQAKATLDLAHKPIQDALDRSAVAKKVADAMDKLHRQRTKGTLDALNGLIPHAALPSPQLVVHMAAFTHASGLATVDLSTHNAKIAVPFNRLAAAKLTTRTMGTQMSSRIKKPWQDFKRLQTAPVKPVAEAKPRADAEFQRRFAGKSPQEAEAEKRAMLAEARTRFAKDPATLQKVLTYIEGHPATRVAPSMMSDGRVPQGRQSQ